MTLAFKLCNFSEQESQHKQGWTQVNFKSHWNCSQSVLQWEQRSVRVGCGTEHSLSVHQVSRDRSQASVIGRKVLLRRGSTAKGKRLCGLLCENILAAEYVKLWSESSFQNCTSDYLESLSWGHKFWLPQTTCPSCVTERDFRCHWKKMTDYFVLLIKLS